jgi:hypothetical protein
MSEEKFNVEDEAQRMIEQEESMLTQVAPEIPKVEPITSLGKAAKFVDDEDSPLAAEIGWKNVPIEYLPSQGLFYAEGTQIAIRAASVSEIRHWSTIDENDLLGVDDMLSFIVEKCVRIKMPNKATSHKDLKEIDRFYLIFAVRDYTFKNGENKIFANVPDEDGQDQKVEVTKDLIDYFNPDEKLITYYSHEEKCYVFNLKNGESFKMYFPSLGVMNFIKNFMKVKQQQGGNFDKSFLKYAPFLFEDWRSLSQNTYDKASHDSMTWSLSKISVLTKITDMLASSVNPQIRYINNGGTEFRAPLNFQGGIKSLFLISDIFGELV